MEEFKQEVNLQPERFWDFKKGKLPQDHGRSCSKYIKEL
jgi:hypothetical protein